MKNDQNFSPAYYANHIGFIQTMAQFPGFLAIANEDDELAMVALMKPAVSKEEYWQSVETARLMAAAPQLLRAASAMMEMLIQVNKTAVVEVFGPDGPIELFDEKWKRLLEYLNGKQGNPAKGGELQLPKFF